ncbi:MAG: OmpA family protein, partial [Bacteroidota bacterium]
SPYEFLIIGNFVSDEKTATVTDCEDVFPYAYYYIDAVSIHEIKKPQNPFTEKTYTKGDKIILKNILFDTDKATLRPTSFEQLDQLVEYLQKNQTFNVKIIGHTDNVGGLEYNLDLSNRRSKSVIDYLIAAGIPADRLAYEGLGATQPIADNLVAEGRAKNRRVELNLF